MKTSQWVSDGSVSSTLYLNERFVVVISRFVLQDDPCYLAFCHEAVRGKITAKKQQFNVISNATLERQSIGETFLMLSMACTWCQAATLSSFSRKEKVT